MISGSPFFQYKGNHSATYNVLKKVVHSGNKVTLVYPTLNIGIELNNAKEIMAVTAPGLKVVPVNIKNRIIPRYYLYAKRRLLRLLFNRNSGELYKQFASYLTYDSNLNICFLRTIQNILSNERFDIIQVDYPSALKVVHNLTKYAIPKVFVNHEIQAIRAERTFHTKKQMNADLIARVGKVEGYFLKQYDAVIALTAIDSSILNDYYSIDSFVSPHAVDPTFWEKKSKDFETTPLVFSGGESHYPNKDALEWLSTDIVPNLDIRLKEYTIYITGKWSEETKQRLSSNRIVFTGYVKDIKEYLSNAISLAPIRIGSGMRIKILEAMLMECGVVSTTIGCEGLDVKDNEHLLIADTAEKFAEKIAMLIKNSDKYASMRTRAREFVRERYNLEVTGKRRVDVLKRIVNQYDKFS